MHGLRISDRALREIAAHASAAWPEEGCGLLIGTRPAGPGGELTVQRVRFTANTAPPEQRRRRFEIDPREVIDAQRGLRESSLEIVGFYHSHPDTEARPSPTDLPFLRLWPRTVWLIAEVRKGETTIDPHAWWLEHPDGSPVEIPIEIDPEPPLISPVPGAD